MCSAQRCCSPHTESSLIILLVQLSAWIPPRVLLLCEVVAVELYVGPPAGKT